MADHQGRTYVLDSNVLIDYLETDPSVLTLFSRFIGMTKVISAGLFEVRQIDEDGCKALGLTVYEPSIEEVDLANQQLVGRLSRFDHLCFFVAKCQGWTCVTNVKALCALCDAHQVAYIRGLRPLIELVKAGRLTRKKASDVAKEIANTNPYMTEKLLAEFQREIGGAAHRKLSPSDACELVEAGFDLEPRDYAEDDPLARTVARYAGMLETALSVQEASELLGVSTSRVRQRLTQERTLYGIKSRSHWLVPAFQFHGGKLIPGVEKVFPALPESLDPVAVLS